MPRNHRHPNTRPWNVRPPRIRRLRLAALRVRRRWRRATLSLWWLSGGVWIAAGALVGFEMLDVLFGAFLLAPELLPFVLLALASIWWLRERGRDLAGRIARWWAARAQTRRWR